MLGHLLNCLSKGTPASCLCPRLTGVWALKAHPLFLLFYSNLPMQETEEMRVRSLGPDGPLQEGVAAHSSILAWRIPRIEEPGELPFIGSQRVR